MPFEQKLPRLPQRGANLSPTEPGGPGPPPEAATECGDLLPGRARRGLRPGPAGAGRQRHPPPQQRIPHRADHRHVAGHRLQAPAASGRRVPALPAPGFRARAGRGVPRSLARPALHRPRRPCLQTQPAGTSHRGEPGDRRAGGQPAPAHHDGNPQPQPGAASRPSRTLPASRPAFARSVGHRVARWRATPSSRA